MTEYNYVLFDLDGTLTDSAEGIINAIIYTLNRAGMKVPGREQLRSFVGPPLADSFMKSFGISYEETKPLYAFFQEYYTEKGWLENCVYEGIPEVLSALKQRDKSLILATSKPEIFARRIMEHFELDQYFDYMIGSSMDGSISSKGAVIDLALRTAGIAGTRSAVMVGDREYDVTGAAQNALACIGVLYGYGSREELEAAGAQLICPTVKELIPVLT